MKEVFISYSSVDLAQATTVRTVLEKNGLSCWMAPRDIPGGSNYTKEIPIAIRNCKVFVLILSKNAQSSHWVLKELDSAVNCGKVILPFMLEDCALNDEFNFLLTGAQRYAAYQKKAEAMETLIGRIRGILNAPSPDRNAPAQEISESTAASEPKKTQKSAIDFFCDAACPACGAKELKELKGRVTCGSFKEHLAKLWILVLTFVFMFVGLLIASFVPHQPTAVILGLTVAGAIIGWVWGSYIFRSVVKRSRIRSGFSSKCYRCTRCQKVFDHMEPLEN